jgi:GH25 family lysozyme M1 (1,4-beta-N-acetylmuramidase)
MIIPYQKRVIDTSRWQGVISWGLPLELTPAVIAKAYDAPSSTEDDRFEYNWRRLKDVGYKRGSYLFWWPKGEKLVKAQVERYVRTLGGDFGDLTYTNRQGVDQPLLAVDVEPLATYKQTGLPLPVVGQAMRDQLHLTLLEIERLTGIVPLIYSGSSDWKYFFPIPAGGQPADWQAWIGNYFFWWSNPPYLKKNYPTAFFMRERVDYECYWDTDYLTSSRIISLAPGVTEADIWAWQYSYKGRLPGINADCDLNWVFPQ